MKIEQTQWMPSSGWSPSPSGRSPAQLVLIFGAPEPIRNARLIEELRDRFPQALLFGCSSAGEISGPHVFEGSLVATAIEFEHTLVRAAHVNLTQLRDSFAAGERLANALPATVDNGRGGRENLAHVLLLSEGLDINGGDLLESLTAHLPAGVTVTGGLAGDGVSFKETLVFHDGKPSKHTVSLVGLYGSRLKVGFGSMGGWEPFGPERLVTRSHKNVVFELDGKPGLALYKQHLGDQAGQLPASGLFFPLSIRTVEDENPVVRTFLTFDESEQSMTFSSNIPQGAYARLAKSNATRLIEGASGAAQTCLHGGSPSPQLAILISCVARKLILTQRTEEEVQTVAEILGPQTVLTGFYSYGEIAPFGAGCRCEMHNQTMTITTLAEE